MHHVQCRSAAIPFVGTISRFPCTSSSPSLSRLLDRRILPVRFHSERCANDWFRRFLGRIRTCRWHADTIKLRPVTSPANSPISDVTRFYGIRELSGGVVGAIMAPRILCFSVLLSEGWSKRPGFDSLECLAYSNVGPRSLVASAKAILMLHVLSGTIPSFFSSLFI